MIDLSSLPKVAVVILNWNGVQLLETFLPSVLKSEYNNTEIYLADNASSDTSIEFTRQHFPSVHIIAMDENRGFAEGYNVALKELKASGGADYYVLLNSDVEVTPGWIGPIIEEMEKDELIGAAQPKIRAQRQKSHFEYAGASGGMIDHLGYPFCRGRIFDELEEDLGQYDEPMEIAWATGCAMFVRAELYHELEGLDKDFFAHFEEIDLCWRVRRTGRKIMVYPQSVVYHVGGATLSTSNPRKTYLNFRNNLVMLIKNKPWSQLWWRLPLRLGLDHVAALLFFKDRKWGDFKAVWRAHFHFFRQIRLWLRKRRNVAQVVDKHRVAPDRIAESEYPQSIVVKAYLNGKKHFSDLA